MESDFLFFLEDQVALSQIAPLRGIRPTGQYSIHMPLYTSCSVIERERDDSTS
jgi:hypothetical protein